MNRSGAPAALVPEIVCSDIEKSRHFYLEVLRFKVRYERPEEKFIYLERDGAELMIAENAVGSWTSVNSHGELGRGVHFQIMVSDIEELFRSCKMRGINLVLAKERVWYRADALYFGQIQFAVADPDGYLLRFAQDLGESTTPPVTDRIVS